MAYKHEELTIWAHASLTVYFKKQEFGLPVSFKTQAPEKDTPNVENVQVLIDGPDFSRRGTKNERYALVHVRIFVNTGYKPTDIYHHLRVKSRVVEALSKEIVLKRYATETYDGMIVGYLRPVPTESITITTISVEEPDSSMLEATYCIELC